MDARERTAAVIVAAGIGQRMGGRVPKQFLEIRGKPILFHTLHAFECCGRIDEIVLVVPAEHMDSVQAQIDIWSMTKVNRIVRGGPERVDSVRNGLEAVGDDAAWVAVHDGVRPLVSPALIEAVLAVAKESGAALPAVPVRDTLKRERDGWVEATIDRSGLWRVQTPQVFRKDLLLEAYRRAAEEDLSATDDAALVERLGHRVRIVEGEERNIKITTKADLDLAERLLAGRE